MKPLIILFTFLALSVTQPSFATEGEVSPAAVKAFHTTFASATDVSWSAGDNMYKVRFVMNTQMVTAYYGQDASLLAITRNITSHQLPLSLQTALKKGHDDAWISELFELSNAEGTRYYITLETADNKTVLRSEGQGWTVFSKTKKD